MSYNYKLNILLLNMKFYFPIERNFQGTERFIAKIVKSTQYFKLKDSYKNVVFLMKKYYLTGLLLDFNYNI